MLQTCVRKFDHNISSPELSSGAKFQVGYRMLDLFSPALSSALHQIIEFCG